MKRVVVFFDCQNIYHTVKDIWPEYYWPNFDPEKLARLVCNCQRDRSLQQIRIYTGVPSARQSQLWNSFWTNKLRALSSSGHFVFKGRINEHGNEKGVDIRLALDLILLTWEDEFDTAVIFSQDTDLNEAIKTCQQLARSQKRDVGIECAYPFDPGMKNVRGLVPATWRRITKAMYDGCIDHRDYRAPLGP